VKNVVESNTYQGLEAKLKFTVWKKVWATVSKLRKEVVM
jgi:hypothetical protein